MRRKKENSWTIMGQNIDDEKGERKEVNVCLHPVMQKLISSLEISGATPAPQSKSKT